MSESHSPLTASMRRTIDAIRAHQANKSVHPEERPMADRPILLSGEMVRATLDDRKTHTRRVVKNPVRFACLTGDCDHEVQAGCDAFMRVMSPYGVVGDRLWVRETFAMPADGSRLLAYQADGECGARLDNGEGDGGTIWLRHGGVIDKRVPPRSESWRGQSFGLTRYGGRWRSSRFMPRWASRLTLEITNVRVERVQSISEADAQAEGVPREPFGYGTRTVGWRGTPDGDWCSTASLAYPYLWNSLNAKRGYGWDVNPLVWVIQFKRVTP